MLRRRACCRRIVPELLSSMKAPNEPSAANACERLLTEEDKDVGIPDTPEGQQEVRASLLIAKGPRCGA